MNTHHLCRVRRMFINDLTPVHTQRHNMRAWVRSVRLLGANWKGLPQPLTKLRAA